MFNVCTFNIPHLCAPSPSLQSPAHATDSAGGVDEGTGQRDQECTMPSCIHAEGRGHAGEVVVQWAEVDALSWASCTLGLHRDWPDRAGGDEDTLSLLCPTSCIKGGGQWCTARGTLRRDPLGKREGHAGGVVHSRRGQVTQQKGCHAMAKGW